jgi:hypothetical protein
VSTSSDTEQVQVTPELLDRIESAVAIVFDNTRDPASYRSDMDAFRDVSTPRHVRALVRRIRELEQEITDMFEAAQDDGSEATRYF